MCHGPGGRRTRTLFGVATTKHLSQVLASEMRHCSAFGSPRAASLTAAEAAMLSSSLILTRPWFLAAWGRAPFRAEAS